MVVLLVVVLVVVLVGSILAGEYLQTRRSVSEAQGGFRLDLLAGSALTLAVIMCSFMLAVTYTSYDSARGDARAEAAAVTAEYGTAVQLPARDDAQAVSQTLICYARAVSYDEWPRLDDSAVTSPRVELWRLRFEQQTRAIAARDDSPELNLVRAADEQRTTTHQVRLTTATEEAPHYLFILLIAVCAASLFFITAFAAPSISRRLRVPVIGVLTVLLGFTLLVIIDLNQPYQGLSRVGPDAMIRGSQIISTNYQDLFGEPVNACDSVGRPTTG